MNKTTNTAPPVKTVEPLKQNSDNYPLEQAKNSLKGEQAMALLALSHTKIEQQLYEQMLSETRSALTRVGTFSIRHLMMQTGIHSYSNVRRGREGLVKKLSIEPQRITGGFLKNDTHTEMVYCVYEPSEILDRRENAGLRPYPKELSGDLPATAEAIEIIRRLVKEKSLSRREALVALKCAEGLSNAEIGEKLMIHQETVKFHLRNIFVKFGVKKRTELMVRLLRQRQSE